MICGKSSCAFNSDINTKPKIGRGFFLEVIMARGWFRSSGRLKRRKKPVEPVIWARLPEALAEAEQRKKETAPARNCGNCRYKPAHWNREHLPVGECREGDAVFPRLVTMVRGEYWIGERPAAWGCAGWAEEAK